MLAKRIIPCLDVKDGRTVKGVNFVNLRDAGDPVELAKAYSDQGADELVFLDISATLEGRKTMAQMCRRVSSEINIPFTIGGGINSLEDMETIFDAGADKVGINSAAIRTPDLINEGAHRFGSQAIVVSIDARRAGGSDEAPQWNVFTKGGSFDTGRDAMDWIDEAQDRGAGEILLTSMDRDGTKNGFDLAMLEACRKRCHVPVVASGGAGCIDHFLPIFERDLADAGLAASIFHFGEVSVPELKQQLKSNGIEIRL